MLATLVLAAAGLAMTDGAHILNSGSTNRAAFDIAVRTGGLTRVTSDGTTREIRIDAKVAQQFLADAKAVKGMGRQAATQCMKSASFGSVSTVTYHGWRSPDLNCPVSGSLAKLASDVNVIAGLASTPSRRRIFLPPNEPRKIPEASPSPTAATPPPQLRKVRK